MVDRYIRYLDRSVDYTKLFDDEDIETSDLMDAECSVGLMLNAIDQHSTLEPY